MKALLNYQQDVYFMYSTEFKTWNVMLAKDNHCLAFGTVTDCENWLKNHSNHYHDNNNFYWLANQFVSN